MKNIFKYITLLIVTFLLFNCSGNKVTHKKSDLPDWYLSTPSEEDFLYAVGEADGPDLGLTRVSAEAAARDDIARQISVKVNNMIQSSKQQVGSQSVSVQKSASNQVVSEIIQGCKIIERHIEPSNDMYKVYALAKISLISVREDFKKQLEDENIRRQLEIDVNLQDILSKEIDKMNGLK